MTIIFNNDADSLEILLVDKKPNCYSKIEEDYIELYNKSTNNLIGYIILNYSKHLFQGTIFSMPWRNINFKKDIFPKICKG